MSSFRVMQFNMQFGQSWDAAAPDAAPINIEGTLSEIRKHNADVVLLQEVEHAVAVGGSASSHPNYTRLSRELDGRYHGVFALPRLDPRELPFGIGLAIFSKTPLQGQMRLDLPSPPVHFDFYGEDKTPTDRVLLGATTIIAGKALRLFTTHLLAFFMLKSSSKEHPQQRRMVADLMRKTQGPALVGGDFNVSGHRALITQMADAGCSSVQQEKITWRRRPYVLDHIFFKGLHCVGHEIVPTTVSDHHVLLADFEVEG